MQVKVFESPDMATGLKLVRQELGPDALILSTRTIRSAKIGKLGKQMLEITAAVDTPLPDPEKKPAGSAAFGHEIYKQNSHFKNEKKNREETSAERHLSSQHQGTDKEQNPENLRKEMDELKSMVKSLAGELTKLHTSQSTPPLPPSQAPTGNKVDDILTTKLRGDKPTNQLEQMLKAHGISAETAVTLSKFTYDSLSHEDLANSEKFYSFLHTTIADLLPVNPIDLTRKDSQRRIALLGPTGVGKTTTLAKIAARYLSSVSNSIALITIDTYRIAAVEQLKVYGEIMHLPVDVVISPQQLGQALEKHKDKELVLIDTAGRSPRDLLSIEDIGSFLNQNFDIENHLVLSATTREEELQDAIAHFRALPIHSTIFTKLDECVKLGVILNIQIQNPNPISYVTNGQRVPEDIVEADSNQLAQLIIPSPSGEVDD